MACKMQVIVGTVCGNDTRTKIALPDCLYVGFDWRSLDAANYSGHAVFRKAAV